MTDLTKQKRLVAKIRRAVGIPIRPHSEEVIMSTHAQKPFAFNLALALFCALTTPVAFADLCKNTNIIVENQFKNGDNEVKIRVLKVNYYDTTDKRWRDNDVKNTEISFGDKQTIVEDLEHVENESVPKMQVLFEFEENKGWSGDMWSNVDEVNSSSCVKGSNYNVKVTGTANKKK